MEIKISPRKATMVCHLFENKFLDIKLKSVSTINIELDPLEFEEEIKETSIQLDCIDIPFRCLTDMQDKEFEFPINPEAGYIDGSIYLNAQHISVDITKICFGRVDGNKLKTRFVGELPFKAEGFDTPNVALDSECVLDFNSVFIPIDILEASEANLEEAYKLVESFFDMNKLSKPKIINNGFIDVISFSPLA